MFGDDQGNVTLDGHLSYVDTNGQTINAPTMIRTGMGSIYVAAANDVNLLDTTAPGVIYTAGQPATGTTSGSTESIVEGNPTFGAYDLLVTNAVNPDGAGDVSIDAGNNITGVESVSGTGSAKSQFWWQWMEIAPATNVSFDQQTDSQNFAQITQTSIDFGAFDQGCDECRRQCHDLGSRQYHQSGGVSADHLVSQQQQHDGEHGRRRQSDGHGRRQYTKWRLFCRGRHSHAHRWWVNRLERFKYAGGASVGEVSTLLAAQDGIFNVSARQGVDIGAMVDPSYIQGTTLLNGYSMHADSQSYSANSALNVISTTGDVSLNTLASPSLIDAGEPSKNDDSFVLPATVEMTA